MSKLRIRTISAMFFAPVVIGAVYFSSISFQVLWTFVVAVCGYELSGMLGIKYGALSPSRRIIYSLIPLQAFIIALLYLQGILGLSVLVVDLVLSIILTLILSTFTEDHNPLKGIGSIFITLIYVVLPLYLLAMMCQVNGDYDFGPCLGLLFLIWANDMGAYFAGSKLGKNKLAPNVSPNKTWEGFFGGLALAIVIGAVISRIVDEAMTVWIIYGAAAGIFGTLGDLFESSLKRYTGVKDSGNIMPGHGGLLDRFDGFFFLIPIIWVLQQFL